MVKLTAQFNISGLFVMKLSRPHSFLRRWEASRHGVQLSPYTGCLSLTVDPYQFLEVHNVGPVLVCESRLGKLKHWPQGQKESLSWMSLPSLLPVSAVLEVHFKVFVFLFVCFCFSILKESTKEDPGRVKRGQRQGPLKLESYITPSA